MQPIVSGAVSHNSSTEMPLAQAMQDATIAMQHIGGSSVGSPLEGVVEIGSVRGAIGVVGGA